MASVGGPTDAASVQVQAAYKTVNTALQAQESRPPPVESVPAPTPSESNSAEGNVGQNVDVTA